MNEDLVIRLGLDAKPMQDEIDRSMGQIKRVGEDSHHSFLHAESSARGFHKVLHSVTEEFPLIGNLAKIVISPIGGMFAAAAAALGYFHEKLKSLNEEWDKIGAAAAKPIGEHGKAIADAHRELERFNNDLQKWNDELGHHDPVIDSLQKRLSLLRLQSVEAEKLAKQNNDPRGADLETRRLQLELAMQQAAAKQLSNRKAGSGTDVESIADELRSHLGRSVVKDSQADIEELKHMAERAQEEIKKLGPPPSDTVQTLSGSAASYIVGGLGPISPQVKSPADPAAKSRYEANLEYLTTTLSDITKKITKEEKAIDEENEARDLLRTQLDEAKKKHQQNVTALDALNAAIDKSKQELSVRPQLGTDTPGHHEGIPNPGMQNLDAYKARTAGALDDWNKRTQGELNDWNKAHGLPYDVPPPAAGSNQPTTVEGFLRDMLTQLKDVNGSMTALGNFLNGTGE